ncbi:Anion transporter, partial [Proteus mirabilis]|nr:Anion transporter [Proteus mirabilis]
MLVLVPIMFIVIYLMISPNIKHKFDLKLEVLEWNNKRVITMIIFLVTVFCWIFSSFISIAFGGVKDLDTGIAVSAAIV